jgi:hypothetical protein
MRLAVIVVVGLLAAACASAPDGASGAAQGEKVCKRMTPTGSNMPQSVCRTKDEWAAIEKQGQEGVEEFERARSQVPGSGQ